MPLGARPRGRFLRFSGERPGAEVGREVAFLLSSSARSARLFSSDGCAVALSAEASAFLGDLAGEAGFVGEAAHDTVLDRGSTFDGSSSRPSLEVSLVFRGDRFGETSCRGCLALRAAMLVGAARRSLSKDLDSSSSSCSMGLGFGAGIAGAFLVA